jgi:hypothetical protein
MYVDNTNNLDSFGQRDNLNCKINVRKGRHFEFFPKYSKIFTISQNVNGPIGLIDD